MRRPSIHADRREGMDVKMTPMIDVVFLLLVFFVWTASFQIIEQVMPTSVSQISGSDTSNIIEPTPEDDLRDITLVVRVFSHSAQGARWTVNDIPYARLADVKHELSNKSAQFKQDVPLIIHPEKDVPLGDVIDLYDLAREQNYGKVQFAASPNS